VKTSLILCGAWLVCVDAFAVPLIIPPAQSIEPTPWVQIQGLAMAGDEALFERFDVFYEPGDDMTAHVRTGADLYRRAANGRWEYVRDFFSETYPWDDSLIDVAMSASVAAIRVQSGLHLFERNASGAWIEGVLDLPRPLGDQVEVHGNLVVALESSCSRDAIVLERGANGHWGETGRLSVPAGSCVASFRVDENAVAVLSRPEGDAPNGNDQFPIALWIFERTGGAWTLAASFPAPETESNGVYGPELDIHEGLVVVSGFQQGAYVYRRDASGWNPAPRLPHPGYLNSIDISDEYVLLVGGDTTGPRSSGHLFRNGPDQTFENVAKFVADFGLFFATMDGNRVMGFTQHSPEFYQIPSDFDPDTPPLVQDDFELGSQPWQVLPGSQFSIVQSGATHVWRQSSLAGDAGAVYDAVRADQTVSADITPTAFNGADRWVGLVTRYTDEQNYYYVTLRAGNDGTRLVLKRMFNGVFSELGRLSPEDTMSVRAGQRYRVTLQSIGNQHTVFIDGQGRFSATDGEHASGKAGVRMYRAAADIDNVVISSAPLFYVSDVGAQTRGGRWLVSQQPPRASQTSLTGDARALYGDRVENSEQTALLTIDELGATGSPWVGLFSRYTDAGNYYYVTLRKSNELSLRKMTNGVISVLDTVTLPVTTQSEYKLRFDTVEDRLRVLVNDELEIERAGAEVSLGYSGLATYRARATFRIYNAYSP
jgi:hypothetical protein